MYDCWLCLIYWQNDSPSMVSFEDPQLHGSEFETNGIGLFNCSPSSGVSLAGVGNKLSPENFC